MPGTPIPKLFFGGRDAFANVLETNAGFEDNGVPYVPSLLTNPFAPAGASGEAIFKNVYLTLTHSMAVDIRVTPIVDFVPYDGTTQPPGYTGVVDERVTFTLPDLTATERLTERFEIGLTWAFPSTAAERLRTSMRGAWFQILVEAINGLAAGDLIFEQIELDYDIVRESVVAETP